MRIAGYFAFFLVSCLFFVYQTFPWNSAKNHLLQTISKQTRTEVSAESLEPSWLTGFVAKGVSIRTRADQEPFEIPEIRGRAKIFSFLTGKQGVIASLPLARGDIDANVDNADDQLDLNIEVENVELALIEPLKGQVGLPLGGKIKQHH